MMKSSRDPRPSGSNLIEVPVSQTGSDGEPQVIGRAYLLVNFVRACQIREQDRARDQLERDTDYANTTAEAWLGLTPHEVASSLRGINHQVRSTRGQRREMLIQAYDSKLIERLAEANSDPRKLADLALASTLIDLTFQAASGEITSKTGGINNSQLAQHIRGISWDVKDQYRLEQAISWKPESTPELTKYLMEDGPLLAETAAKDLLRDN